MKATFDIDIEKQTIRTTCDENVTGEHLTLLMQKLIHDTVCMMKDENTSIEDAFLTAHSFLFISLNKALRKHYTQQPQDTSLNNSNVN